MEDITPQSYALNVDRVDAELKMVRGEFDRFRKYYFHFQDINTKKYIMILLEKLSDIQMDIVMLSEALDENRDHDASLYYTGLSQIKANFCTHQLGFLSNGFQLKNLSRIVIDSAHHYQSQRIFIFLNFL